jgi:hypothetical protein
MSPPCMAKNGRSLRSTRPRRSTSTSNRVLCKTPSRPTTPWTRLIDLCLHIIATEFGAMPLDLVSDDASHLLRETRASFNALFPRLRSGGEYIIEDCEGVTTAMK